MKKNIFISAVLFIFTLFSGCNKKNAENVISIGASAEPHAEILNLISQDLENQGYKLKIIEFVDYVTPNEAVESGEIDANYFQHLPYMESFNKEKGYHLVNAGSIHIEPLAVYSKKYSKLEELPEGAVIAIPNDPTNEGRSLLLLQAADLIKLSSSSMLTAVPADIIENIKKLKFKEIEAASLPRILNDTDAAVINGNYALPAGLNAAKDGIFVEGAQSPYVNIICTKAGREKEEKIQALVKAVQTQKVKDYIAKRYKNGEVIPVF